MTSDKTSQAGKERRAFLQKASYIAPAIITVAAIPSLASAGSGYKIPKEPKEPKIPKIPKI